MQPSAGIRTAVSSPHKWNTLFYTAPGSYKGVFTIHAEPRDMEFGEEDVLSTICLKNVRLCKMCSRTGLTTGYRLITRQM